jgi:hypothetical protein
LHIRFRLGGPNFPPLIYYKLYVHRGVCDLNSFAPRDYTALRKVTKKATVNMTFEGEEAKAVRAGWYERFDNNGWRPITDNILSPFDPVELETAGKPVPYHHDRKVRKKLTAQERRKKKLKWLKRLYLEAKSQENTKEVTKDTPFDSATWLDLEEGSFEAQVSDLLEWSDSLDYDKYVSNWSQLATSATL